MTPSALAVVCYSAGKEVKAMKLISGILVAGIVCASCVLASDAVRMPPAIHKSTRKAAARQRAMVDVAIIAPSYSTSAEARRVMGRNGWVESSLKGADGILVVVRSMLFDPLSLSYRSVKGLQDDAEMQLNFTGPKFHVYVYLINSDLSVVELNHVSYKAAD